MTQSVSSTSNPNSGTSFSSMPPVRPEVSGTLAYNNGSIFETAGAVGLNAPTPATSSFCAIG